MKTICFYNTLLLLILILSGCDKLTGSWSKKSPNGMTWNDAKAYCENLVENGRSDWKLPTISELRTLVKNCPGTETGGACKITNDCLLSNDCKNYVCDGCIKSQDGYSKLEDKDRFWSSSESSDNTFFAWYVNFINGSVDYYYKNNLNDNYVRCLR